ncbi:hypothetical protein CAter282_1363 [Collimonas arenae]|uniref:Putative auto-transporter adhesin head GIN domain-containing protein n=1 Tax=Collimonas arenae TaxID=279058 RepID=A0A127PNS7_9BURK|nr:head GIN domain-containing protein [Collimonas arenae]AMO99254.1 hypothetical protein CAter10_1468 [Collimonas arenae]AMP09154.1 hypothetical protein CAter282_1363 [Collimonas arenae]
MKSLSRRTFFLALAAAAVLPLVSTGSMAAEVIKAERPLGDFQQIELMDAVNVYLTQGPAKPAVIEAEASIVPRVELTVSGSALRVSLKGNSFFSTHHDINVYLTAPDVNTLSIYGSGDIKVKGKLSSKDTIKISIAGSGDVDGELNAPNINASIAGAGNINVKGKTRDLRVSIAGSGDYDGFSLLSENTRVSIVGSGDANVYASKQLNVSTAGSGDVTYEGDPQVKTSIVGSGSVNKR